MNIPDTSSAERTLIDELRAAGIDTAGFDMSRAGEFQRLPLIGGRQSKTDASVKVHGYDPLVVTWTNFKDGIDGKFVGEKPINYRYKPTKPKPRVYQRGKAESLWSWAQEASDDHPYLRAKRVRNYGLREYQGTLLVPLYDEAGTLHNVQRIYPHKKRYLKGCRKEGCFYQIGYNSDRLVIVEGYATGATIFEHLGWTVIVAFDCYNLEPAASALRRVYPRERFIFAADNDRHTEANPGVTKAVEAARKHGGEVWYPKFRDGEPGSDWNDLEALHGAQAVEVLYDLCR